MDIFGALAIAAIATVVALSQSPAVRKAVQTAVNTVVTPVVEWWNENVAAPSASSGDDGDDGGSPAPARQSGGEIGAAAQPEPTYDPDASKFFEGDTPETLAAEVADQQTDVSSASHIYLPDSEKLEGLDLELLADYSAEVAASLMLMVVHEPGILATALMTMPTVARTIDGLLAKSYLVEEGSDGLLTWLEYDFGPALKRRLEKNIAAKDEEATAFGGWHGKVGYGDLRMAPPGWDDTLQDEPVCPPNTSYNKDTGMCEFEYGKAQRHQVVDYALQYAYQPNLIYTAFNYPGGICPNWVMANPKLTDCANFVSQALQHADFPETPTWFTEPVELGLGSAQYCPGTGLEGDVPTGEYLEGGRVGDTSRWTGATELKDYLEGLGGEYKDVYKALWTELADQHGIWNPAVFELHPELIAPAIEEAQRQGKNLAEEGIGAGDVMYSLTQVEVEGKVYSFPHTSIVVAWGPPAKSWEELRRALNLTEEQAKDWIGTWDSTQDMYDNTLLSDQYVEGYVPYVLDHGPHGAKSATGPQSPEFTIPRPYYALWWAADEHERLSYEGGELGFVRIPSSINISPSE